MAVLSDSYLEDSSIESSELEITESAATVNLEVRVQGAKQLKALYVEIEYDDALYQPVSASATGALAQSQLPDQGHGALLELAVLDEPGKITHGQVLTQPNKAIGFSGDGVLTTVVLERRKQHDKHTEDASSANTGINTSSSVVRSISIAPRTSQSAAKLELDLENSLLRWEYSSAGDYDQNGFTYINDLTPLGVHFGAIGPFEYQSIESVVDGNGDGEINIGDVTPIGQNYRAHVDEYFIYGSDSPANDYPTENNGLSPIPPRDDLLFENALGNKSTERLRFEFSLDDPLFWVAYWVRPYDGTDVTIGTPSNIAYSTSQPIAELSSDKTGGVAPVDVQFDASESFDHDGELVQFEWDFEGDSVFEYDSGTDSVVTHTYDAEGVYQPTVKVSDDKENSATASITVYIALVNTGGPTAHIVASRNEGAPPLAVEFLASGSTDPDNNIVRYSWDFNDDYIEDATGETICHSFDLGYNGARLTVIDAGGLSDSLMEFISVYWDGEWHIQVVDDDSDAGANCQLAIQDGLPAIAYCQDSGEDQQVAYAVGKDQYAADGFDSSSIVVGINAVSLRLTLINNEPAIAYGQQTGLNTTLWGAKYDESTSNWLAPVELDNEANTGSYLGLNVAAGLPCACYYWTNGVAGELRFKQAESISFDWPTEPVVVDGGDLGENVGTLCSMTVIGDLPTIAYSDAATNILRYAIADDSSCTTWTDYGVIDDGVATFQHVRLCVINGNPAIAFADTSANQVCFIRAQDELGTTWPEEWVVVAEDTASYLDLADIDGQASIAYHHTIEGALYYARARDFNGEEWTTELVEGGSGNNVGSYVSLAEIDTHPSMAYYDSTAKTLKFAIRYRD